MLQRLIYFSERDRACINVRDLAAAAAERNRRRGITGLLVADDRCFVQVLEGHRNAVSSLFLEICKDPRHRNIVLVEVCEIEELSHPDWGMTRLDDSGKIAATWRRIHTDRVFDPWSLSAEEIKDFMALVAYDMQAARDEAQLSPSA